MILIKLNFDYISGITKDYFTENPTTSPFSHAQKEKNKIFLKKAKEIPGYDSSPTSEVLWNTYPDISE